MQEKRALEKRMIRREMSKERIAEEMAEETINSLMRRQSKLRQKQCRNEKNMKKKIAIIFGGCSPEYNVSLQSAYAVISHMNRKDYMPVPVGITRQGDWYYFDGDPEEIRDDTWRESADCIPAAVLQSRSESALIVQIGNYMEKIRIDAAFPILHGKNGEDGTVQGVFALAGIPIVGCGVLSSALCMDKEKAHRIAASAGIRVPKSFVCEKNEEKEKITSKAAQVGYPLFVKPVAAGSSFGITKINGEEELVAAVENALRYDNSVIIEEAIEGFEVGCAVLGNRQLTMGEIDEVEMQSPFFDYGEKYSPKTVRIHVPARIEEETAQRIRSVAQKIYLALGCKGFARVDLFLAPDGEIIFNEINTIPGFTAHSRFPRMIQAAGMSFEQLISAVIEMAAEE